jgi:hypothetical protein
MSSVPETECRKHGAQFGDKLGDNKRAGREKTIRAATEITTTTKTKIETGTGAETGMGAARRPLSPYTVHNLDTAIAHLEIAMGADKAMAIFGSSYWHERVRELRSTPGILDVQERRLRSLLDRFAVPG